MSDRQSEKRWGYSQLLERAMDALKELAQLKSDAELSEEFECLTAARESNDYHPVELCSTAIIWLKIAAKKYQDSLSLKLANIILADLKVVAAAEDRKTVEQILLRHSEDAA